MWKPKFKGDLTNLYGKQIIIYYGHNDQKNETKVKGTLKLVTKNKVGEVICVIIDHVKLNINTDNPYSYVSSCTVCTNLISNIEIKYDEIKDCVKEKCLDYNCQDISELIVDFSDVFIPL